jgi:hypothetical protein
VEDVKVIVVGAGIDVRRTLINVGIEVLDQLAIPEEQKLEMKFSIMVGAHLATDWPSGIVEDTTPWYRKLEKKRRKK